MEYGTPSENAHDEYDNNVSGPLLHPIKKEEPIAADSPKMISNIDLTPSIVADADRREKKAEDNNVAKTGCFITYKKKFSNDDIVDNILQPDKYPLHKEFLGHKVGENVSFRGKEYEIIGII